MGTMVTRKHRELSDEEIKRIYDTYHKWRDEKEYEDVNAFCKSVLLDDIRNNEYVLTPGRFVGIEEIEDDGEPFEEKMIRLTNDLSDMFKRAHEIEEEIKRKLGDLGYDF
jgi:type I restriction enzyme M protein